MNDVVMLKQVCKSFAQLNALDNVSLNLQQGEILGLLGHNGAGKTTTMKLILGVIGVSSGTIRLFGESPTGPQADKLRRCIGYLPENVSFYSQLTGQEVLEYFAKLKGLATSGATDLLNQVGLSHAADRRVKTYSKGMRQRLGLAQALLGNPRLLLLDEPTAGLDPAATYDFYKSMDDLRKHGTSILLSSHVLPGIEKYIDRAAILGNGKLLAAGSLPELSGQAQLPLTVHASGDWPTIDWQQQFQDHNVSFSCLNGKRLKLSAPLNSKMEVMRILLSEPAVKDIQVVTPTLEDLYNYYSKQVSAEVKL
jgi:Cu-processing system ATP-binding protein